MAEPLSPRNPRLKRLGRLARDPSARREESAYVIEGFTLLGDALAAGAELECVFVESASLAHPVVAQARAAGVAVVEVGSGALRPVVDVTSPQPVAAIARLPRADLESAMGATDFVLVLAGIADPGNAGTLVRSGEAAGVGAVVLTEGSVDAFGPRCVRASAGAVFRLPIVTGVPAARAFEALGRASFDRIGTVVADGTPYDEIDLSGPVALVVGNEASGLAADLTGGAHPSFDHLVTIPMGGGAESLNVAMAATVVAFEVRRQRRARAAQA